MVQKLEFASQEWLDELHALLLVYTQKVGPELELSLCEVFTGVPTHLDTDGSGVIAWHCRIRNGSVMMARGEIDDADLKTTADYQYILPFARMQLNPANIAEMEAEHARGVALGLLKREGDRSVIPREFYGMHNDIAALTQ
jgi:hypothetical protein